MNKTAETVTSANMAKWVLHNQEPDNDLIYPNIDIPLISLLKADQRQFVLNPQAASSAPQSFYRSMLKVQKILHHVLFGVKEAQVYRANGAKLQTLSDELHDRISFCSSGEIDYLAPQLRVVEKAVRLFEDVIITSASVQKEFTCQQSECVQRHKELKAAILQEHDDKESGKFNKLLPAYQNLASALHSPNFTVLRITKDISSELDKIQTLLQHPQMTSNLETTKENLTRLIEKCRTLEKQSLSIKPDLPLMRTLANLRILDKVIQDILNYLPKAHKSLEDVRAKLNLCDQERNEELISIQEVSVREYNEAVEHSISTFWEKLLNYEVTKFSISAILEDLVIIGLELGRASHDPAKLSEVIEKNRPKFESLPLNEQTIFNHMIDYAKTRKKEEGFSVYEQLVIAGSHGDFSNFNKTSKKYLAMYFDVIEENSNIWNSVTSVNKCEYLESLSQCILAEIFGIKDNDSSSDPFPEVHHIYKQYISELLGSKEDRNIDTLLKSVDKALKKEKSEPKLLVLLLISLALKIKKYTESGSYDFSLNEEYQNMILTLKKMHLTDSQIAQITPLIELALDEIQVVESFAAIAPSDQTEAVASKRRLVKKEVADHLMHRINDLDDESCAFFREIEDRDSVYTSADTWTPSLDYSRSRASSKYTRGTSSTELRTDSQTSRATTTPSNFLSPIPFPDTKIPLSSPRSKFRRSKFLPGAPEKDSPMNRIKGNAEPTPDDRHFSILHQIKQQQIISAIQKTNQNRAEDLSSEEVISDNTSDDNELFYFEK